MTRPETDTGSLARSGRSAPPSRRATIAAVLILAASLVCIGVITLSPAEESTRLPFWCFRCGARAGVDVLLNILLFVPIGCGLGLLRLRARWAVVFIVSVTLIVEALQFGFIPGRFASFRDILANSAGGLAGWQLALAWRSLASPSEANASSLSLAAASAWIAIQIFTAWAMAVVTPPPPWWAQIRLRDLGFPAVFQGEVVRSSLGTVDIRYSDQLEESAMVRRQLLDGGEMRSIVTGVNPSAGPAPILLLAADDQLSEIAALVQTGDAVFFRIRTRAAVVGLRNPAIRLSNVFPPGSGQDTVTLTASFAAGRYRIESDRAGDHRERTLAVSPSWIWALLMPIPHYSFGAEVRIVTAAWLFAVLGLAAFWGARSAPSGVTATSRRRMGAAVRILVAILAGLAVVPVGFGLSVSHWSEWLAAVVGVACGWMLGLRRSPPRGGPVPTGAATS